MQVKTRSTAQRKWDRENPRREYKRKWERQNRWRYQDTCPDCGALKYKKAKRCRPCSAKATYKAGGGEKLQAGFQRWKEENPEEWQRIRKWLASGKVYY